MEKLLCKYYLHGACAKGIKCQFAHDLTAKTNNSCKFYLAGSCSYGKSCRYDHIKPVAKVLKPVNDSSPQKEDKRCTLVVLNAKKANFNENNNAEHWAEAVEFVPGRKSHQTDNATENTNNQAEAGASYSKVASFNLSLAEYEEDNDASFNGDIQDLLCPFAAVRDCPYGDDCDYLHGLECDMCGRQCLHPTDMNQQAEHKAECLKYHECEMERAFAADRSNAVACAICLDIVKEKSNIVEQVFGILENCTHPFCLLCIRKWRSSPNQDKSVVRSCPICRTNSWFVTPSEFWVEDTSEKKHLIDSYKSLISTKHCRNFDFGKGVCSFGSSCFYKHVNADGIEEEIEKPILRHREDADGESSIVKTFRLNEFIAMRE